MFEANLWRHTYLNSRLLEYLSLDEHRLQKNLKTRTRGQFDQSRFSLQKKKQPVGAEPRGDVGDFSFINKRSRTTTFYCTRERTSRASSSVCWMNGGGRSPQLLYAALRSGGSRSKSWGSLGTRSGEVLLDKADETVQSTRCDTLHLPSSKRHHSRKIKRPDHARSRAWNQAKQLAVRNNPNRVHTTNSVAMAQTRRTLREHDNKTEPTGNTPPSDFSVDGHGRTMGSESKRRRRTRTTRNKPAQNRTCSQTQTKCAI